MEEKKIKNSLFYPFENMLLSLYLFVMLGFFPVFFKYQYAEMGDGKYQIFLYATIVCLSILFLCLFIRVIINRLRQAKYPVCAEQTSYTTKKQTLYLLDKAILLYFVCTTLSYLLCDFKKKGLYGASGWYMGYLSQILFVGIYFIVSVLGRHYKLWISLLMVSSAIVFLVGILHRFDVDILHIYGDLELHYKVQFLSTMGQASWYSSFLCTVFPIGLYVFYVADNKKIRMAAGLYSVISMCTLVTQNTDSAFLSLGATIILLFYLSFDGKKETLRFLQVLMLIFASFTGMGILQRIFADSMISIDKMSLFWSKGPVSPMLLFLCGVIYAWRKKTQVIETDTEGGYSEDASDSETKIVINRKPFWILFGALGVAVLLGMLFILLNSTGVLYSQFGYQNVNNYLLFTDDWGNRRGFAWRLVCEMYGELPFLQKLTGVGPECFSFYAQSVPEYAHQIKDYWGSLSLTNAHNEYLTKLMNLGLVGLASYVFMLGSAVYVFVKHRKDYVLLPAFALCVVSYAAHNVFCYEQVCCTPVFYILLGFGSFLIKEKNSAHTISV